MNSLISSLSDCSIHELVDQSIDESSIDDDSLPYNRGFLLEMASVNRNVNCHIKEPLKKRNRATHCDTVEMGRQAGHEDTERMGRPF